MRITKFLAKNVDLETIIDMPWWYKIWQLSGSSRIRAKQKLLRKHKGACKSSCSRMGSLKSFTLTISCNLAKLVKIFPGITVRRHRTTETNGIAERPVRRVKEGTSAVLLQSGLDAKLWADSTECQCCQRKIQDLLSDGKTLCERRFGVPFKGQLIPFGSVDETRETFDDSTFGSHAFEKQTNYEGSHFFFKKKASTNLDVKQEKRIDDYWNIDGSRDLSDPWTGFTQFTLLEAKAPDGYMWSGVRFTRKQLTSRPDHLWPEIWKTMGKNAKLKEKQKWSEEKLHLENARKLRGIYFIDPEDTEFKETIKNARKKLETSVAPAMPCKIMKNCGSGGSDKIQTKLACILEADESTRLRMGNSVPSYHEDHIAGKGDN